MNKIKRIFNSIIICFAMVSTLGLGLYFNSTKTTSEKLDAELATYSKITNKNYDYLSISKSNEDAIKISDDKTIFLVRGGTVDFGIALEEIIKKEAAINPTDTSTNPAKIKGINYAYIPTVAPKDEEGYSTEQEYYYFRFSSALSLFYNTANTDPDPTENLLEGNLISNFAKENQYKQRVDGSYESGPFLVSDMSNPPQKFEMSIGLNSNLGSSKRIDGQNVTLGREGLYTLVINGRIYHTTDDGQTFSDRELNIRYSFMIFNFDTYFNTTTELPETPMDYVQRTQLSSALSATHSYYFFSNYTGSSNGNYGQLPTFTYDPSKYQMSITYTDTDSESYVSTIEFNADDNSFVQKDSRGKEIAKENQFVLARYDNTRNRMVLTFNDLGYYDLSFDFIYTGSKGVYLIPLSTKKQRLYMYGYQVLYTDYDDKDEATQTRRAKELKQIDPEDSTFFNSADITEYVAHANGFHNAVTFETDINSDLYDAATKAIKNEKLNIPLVSTNQTPIQFRSNASNLKGYVYKLSSKNTFEYINDNQTNSTFTATNINEAGTYLILLDYTYTNFMSSSASDLSDNHHYQVFYFKVENKTPSVNVVDETGKTIATRGYTNKSIYIFDTSASSPYDATVRISLEAKDYANDNTLIFPETDIDSLNLAAYGIEYFNKPTEEDNVSSTDPRYNKRGVRISADASNDYRNATFTIRIYSQNTNVPSTRSITIDTNPIEALSAYNVQFATNSSYTKLGKADNITNQSVVFSWARKDSGAPTYGYYKYYPIEYVQYYADTSTNANANNNLLRSLMDSNSSDNPNLLPVNAMLDMGGNKNWVNYSNAYSYTNQQNISAIPSTYVRSQAGLYLFEVYDAAGNVTFDVFLVDNTSPLFVKKIVTLASGQITRDIAKMNETITISPANEATILWARYKGIYIKDYNLTSLIANLNPIGVSEADAKNFETKIETFFNGNAQNEAHSIRVQNAAGSFNSGELTYNGQYLKVEVNDEYYFRHAEKNSFELKTGRQYTIQFLEIDEDGQERPIEGTYRFLVRDKANAVGNDSDLNLKEHAYINYPSGYLAITVSSDASALKVTTPKDHPEADGKKETELDREGYTLSGQFYELKDSHGEIIKLSKTDDSDTTKGIIYSQSTLAYRYAYYRPVKGDNSLTISFIPVSTNENNLSSVVESVNVYYYPFVKQHKNINTYNKGEEFTATAWYYELASNPTRTIPVYPNTKNYEENEVATYTLSFDGTGIAEPGLYEIVRTYSLRKGSIDKYDYYERTLSVYVDNFNTISKQEIVEKFDDNDKTTGQTASESLVGGDILISMYTLKDQGAIHVSFPNYNNDTGLNSGSFYTKDNVSAGEALTIRPETNKLPLEVKIPEYKYTNYYNYDLKNNSYSVVENQSLSRFGNAYICPVDKDGIQLIETTDNNGNLSFYKEVTNEDGTTTREWALLDSYQLRVYNLVVKTFKNYGTTPATALAAKNNALAALEDVEVPEYKLSATIKREWTEKNQNNEEVTRTQIFKTYNGNSVNGYLTFYAFDSVDAKEPTSLTPVTDFSLDGTYDVTIYQAEDQGSTSDFYDFYRFTFKVENPKPNFEVLNSEEQGLNADANGNIVNYYTNSKEILIRWQDSDSPYMANINKDAIVIRKNGSTHTGDLLVKDKDYTISPNPTTLTNTISINLQDKGLWANGQYLQIQMQFEGHNNYYHTVTKNVYVDFAAPIENLKGLMENVASLSRNTLTRLYLERNAREFKDADSNLISTSTLDWNNTSKLDENMKTVSYSFSARENTMRYYAYNVTRDYLLTLKNSAINGINTEVKQAYAKLIGDKDALTSSYTQMNDKQGFAADAYTDLTELNPSLGDLEAFEYDNYYEIVEMDKAGNMTVYIVHIYNENAEFDADLYDKADKTESERNQLNYPAIKYTNKSLGSAHKTLGDRDLDDQVRFAPNDYANIYSNSGFEIQELNYLSDPWGIYRITLNRGITRTYMLSPWISDDEILQITTQGSNVTFTPIKLADLFAGNLDPMLKHTMEIGSRFHGTESVNTVLISVADTTLITTKNSTGNPVSLDIDVPSATQAISNFTPALYPVKITISNLVDKNWQVLDSFENYTGNPALWNNDGSTRIAFNLLGNTLSVRVTLQTSTSAEKLKYDILDNFGNTTTIIQLSNEESCQEILGEDIYAFNEPDNSITYLSTSKMTYQYNEQLYSVKVFKKNENLFVEDKNKFNYFDERFGNTASIRTISFKDDLSNNYDVVYKIEIYDVLNTELLVKTLQLRMYCSLPIVANSLSDESKVNFIAFMDKNNKHIKAEQGSTYQSLTHDNVNYIARPWLLQTYSSNVTMRYSNGHLSLTENEYSYENQYNYSIYLTTDGTIYEDITNSFNNGYSISGAGDYYFLIIYDITYDDNNDQIFRNECKIIHLSILDASSVYYTVTINGERVEKSTWKYFIGGREQTENYIVSVPWSERNLVHVEGNQSEDIEVKTDVKLVNTYPTGTNVYVDVYYYSNKLSNGYFTVIFMGKTTDILTSEKFTYEDASGSPIRISKTQSTTLTIVAEETQVDFNQFKLNWNAYYGISVNKVNIEVEKLYNGRYEKVDLTTYSTADGENNYIYLTRSGTYHIRFYDSCTPRRNEHLFGNGNYLSLVFLNSVPFTISYTDADGVEQTTEPVAKAVYNSEVKLNLTNLSSYFQTIGYPVINVTKDGKAYSISPANYVYTFSEPGYYTVKFAATSLGGVALRQEEFSFTIINANESRYSYEFSPYASYYVKRVMKNGQDITANLVDFAGGNVVTVGENQYLSRLLISYYDERTGAGRYTITVNTGDDNYNQITDDEFTFSLWINMATPPISVSIGEGESTTSSITVTFNAYNLYDAVGDSIIRIGNTSYAVNADTLETLGGENARLRITQRGTYYIQIYTPSGALLYSYKVTKTDPLNTWAIIAIVLGVVAVAVITFVTIKLRKRLKVK